MIHDIKIELFKDGRAKHTYFVWAPPRKDGTLASQLSKQIRSGLGGGYEVRLSVPPNLFTQRRK